MESEPLRDFADRFFRDALKNPENLRDFLMDAVPALAPGFDFTRVKVLDPDFLLPNWRRREADLLFEIPFRADDQEEQLALVCVLIEHQTKADARMPLRMLLELVLYWERQWQAWEKAKQPKEPFRLTPVLPIVLHTGTQVWGSARSVGDMLGPPAAFHAFAPAWSPVFWELAEHSPEQLLNAEHAFIQVLTVVRMEGEERDAFAKAFQETVQKLDAIHGVSRVRWAEMIKWIYGWVMHRRPRVERPLWSELAATTQEDELRKEELRAMAQLVGKTIYDEGREDQVRDFLFELGPKRFGTPPPPEVVLELKKIEDLDRLKRMYLRLFDASSWSELLETL